MGWTFPWASSLSSDFNFDFNVSITEEQQREGVAEYNYRTYRPRDWTPVPEGVMIDSINIDVEDDVDLRGFTDISNDVRSGAQQFRVNINIKSNTASTEQINRVKSARDFRLHSIR
jgi:predicted dithiol-disulfide oxidoreductase (DUF899 family)